MPAVTEFVTSASNEKDARKYNMSLEVGDNLEEAVDLYGSQIVYDLYVDKLIVKCQNTIRLMMKAGKTDAEINEVMKTWRPDTKRVQKKSKSDKLAELWASLSEDERKAFLAGKA